MSDICHVRQPIFGSTGALLAYDIRFHDSGTGDHGFNESVLSGSFDVVRGGMPAFVVASRAQLLDDTFHVATPGSAIVMLPPYLAADAALADAVARYRAHGGVLALDLVGASAAPTEALLPYVSWARINVSREGADGIGAIRDRLRQGAGQHAPKLIAAEIDAPAQYESVRKLGVDAFQGGFFSRPESLPSASLPQSTVAALRLLSMARDQSIQDRVLEDVIAADPVLTFQLLRLVNSAALGLRGVSSIGQALRLIGRNAFLRWLAVAIASARPSKNGVDQELVRQAVERGRLLEQLAGGPRDGGTLFLVGLFSLLDTVFRMPLAEILSRVVLSDEANAALLHRTGPYADAIMFAESYELGLFEHAAELASEMGLDPARVGDFYTNAITWTAEAIGATADAPTPPGRR